MNTGTIVDGSYRNHKWEDNPAACILWCNLMAPAGHHMIDRVTSFVIKLLNAICRYQNKGHTLFRKTLLPAHQIKVPIQTDAWSCGLQITLCRDNLLAFLLEEGNVTNNDVKTEFTDILTKYMTQGNVLEVREELLKIVNFIAFNSIGKGRY
jgi:hypothetical protein